MIDPDAWLSELKASTCPTHLWPVADLIHDSAAFVYEHPELPKSATGVQVLHSHLVKRCEETMKALTPKGIRSKFTMLETLGWITYSTSRDRFTVTYPRPSHEAKRAAELVRA